MNEKITTLDEFIFKRQNDFEYAAGELTALLRDIGVAAKIINHSAQIIPSPSQNFEVSKIRLPHFVNKIDFILKFIRGRNQDVRWSRYQSSFL